MAISYKNFWSLNVDEVVVTGKLRNYFKKHFEVFMPLNAQLKDIDLVIENLNNKKLVNLQVKGSRAYEPNLKERNIYGEGSVGWFFIESDKIRYSNADYFIFLLNIIVNNSKKGRTHIEQHTITIKPKKLWELCKRQKELHKRYSFYIWINPKIKRAFDYRDEKKKGRVELSRYLDERGFEQLSSDLG